MKKTLFLSMLIIISTFIFPITRDISSPSFYNKSMVSALDSLNTNINQGDIIALYQHQTNNSKILRLDLWEIDENTPNTIDIYFSFFYQEIPSGGIPPFPKKIEIFLNDINSIILKIDGEDNSNLIQSFGWNFQYDFVYLEFSLPNYFSNFINPFIVKTLDFNYNEIDRLGIYTENNNPITNIASFMEFTYPLSADDISLEKINILSRFLQIHNQYNIPLNLYIMPSIIKIAEQKRKSFVDSLVCAVNNNLVFGLNSFYGYYIPQFFNPLINDTAIKIEKNILNEYFTNTIKVGILPYDIYLGNNVLDNNIISHFSNNSINNLLLPDNLYSNSVNGLGLLYKLQNSNCKILFKNKTLYNILDKKDNFKHLLNYLISKQNKNLVLYKNFHFNDNSFNFQNYLLLINYSKNHQWIDFKNLQDIFVQNPIQEITLSYNYPDTINNPYETFNQWKNYVPFSNHNQYISGSNNKSYGDIKLYLENKFLNCIENNSIFNNNFNYIAFINFLNCNYLTAINFSNSNRLNTIYSNMKNSDFYLLGNNLSNNTNLLDVDYDGIDEVILKNDSLFVVISRIGGDIKFLFDKNKCIYLAGKFEADLNSSYYNTYGSLYFPDAGNFAYSCKNSSAFLDIDDYNNPLIYNIENISQNSVLLSNSIFRKEFILKNNKYILVKYYTGTGKTLLSGSPDLYDLFQNNNSLSIINKELVNNYYKIKNNASMKQMTYIFSTTNETYNIADYLYTKSILKTFSPNTLFYLAIGDITNNELDSLIIEVPIGSNNVQKKLNFLIENPIFNNKLVIKSNNNDKLYNKMSINIYDISGKLVKNIMTDYKNEFVYDIEFLSSGIYFLKIEADREVYKDKFLYIK